MSDQPTPTTGARCPGVWDRDGFCTACGARYHCAHCGQAMNVMASGHWDQGKGVWLCLGVLDAEARS